LKSQNFWLNLDFSEAD